MKAIVKYGELPGQVDCRDIPEPVCGAYEVKIEVKACAICMTDLHIIQGEYPWETGVPLGHEFCGVVIQTGSRVSRFRAGDRVVACMNGGFARYVVKREDDWVFALPDQISFPEGALLEPLCAAANSVLNRSRILPGDHVLIEGPGVIGLFALQTAKLLGARVMMSGTGADRERLEMAKKMGADRIVNAEQEALEEAVADFTGGQGLDTVLECSGSQAALDAGLSLLRYDGQLTQVGIFGKPARVDLGQLVYNNRRLVGSIAYDRDTWQRCIGLVKNGLVDVKSLISAQLPLSEWRQGFERTAGRTGYRVVLIP
ncbi:MAG: zinc-binding dehydrogenase [Eubacteriales bacterium]|nr:zinc-binding dehydrogenase [Eubacteriales bacterium]